MDCGELKVSDQELPNDEQVANSDSEATEKRKYRFNLPNKETLATIATTNGNAPLCEAHAQRIKESSISDEVREERHYMSVDRKQAMGLGFSKTQVGKSGGLL